MNSKIGKEKYSLSINSLTGGNGDIWMRLVSLYSVAELKPQLEIRILIPAFFRPLAQYTFGDRLEILSDAAGEIKLKYSSLGIKDLFKGFLKGESYILPYQRVIIKDKKKIGLKDYVNVVVFNIAQSLGLVHIPDWKWIPVYQGFLDIVGINKLRDVNYDEFVLQLKRDHEPVYQRLQKCSLYTADLQIPPDLHENVLVFPTGTSRQFVPAWWAKQYLPDAYYAFFFKDKEVVEFEKAGLKIIKYFSEPGEILRLSQHSRWTISTDSFPSHVLQSGSRKSTLLLTEVGRTRIVAPAFNGYVVEAVAPCHPCLHLDKKNHPLCAAGYSECIN